MQQTLLSSSDISPDGKIKQSGVLFSASEPNKDLMQAQYYAVEDAKALDEVRNQLQAMIGSR